METIRWLRHWQQSSRRPARLLRIAGENALIILKYSELKVIGRGYNVEWFILFIQLSTPDLHFLLSKVKLWFFEFGVVLVIFFPLSGFYIEESFAEREWIFLFAAPWVQVWGWSWRSKWTVCKSLQGFLGCAAGDWLLGWFGDGSDGGILFLVISSDSLDCWDAGSCSMCWQRWSICLPVLSGLGCRLIHPWFYRTTWMARALARNRCIY